MSPRVTLGSQPRRFALVACLLFLLACSATPAVVVPGVPRPVPRAEGYQAGVAVADITPPLHLSLFGHGPEGRIAAGVRLRLRCQIFVIATRDDIVALVPCDLQAPSMALQRGIVEQLEQSGIPISADRLFIMATHTHAAPGHYFESRRYSGTFSSQAPGYDQRVVDFLVQRIAAGVADAFAALAPACIGWKQKKIWGRTFNRSYVPFLANEGSGEEEDPVNLAKRAEQRRQNAKWRTILGKAGEEIGRTERAPPAGEDPTPAEEAALLPTGAEKAVDPELSVLAVYRRADASVSCEGSRLQGVLAVYGMHPTGVPNTNELYHGDIFGFAVRTAEGWLSSPPARDSAPLSMVDQRRLESADADGEHVVVGLANGVEGDVSPKLNFQAMSEARKHGRDLGQAIAELTREIDHPSADGRLHHLSWDLRFPEGQYDADPRHTLCEHAELGMAAAGGARDGPTRVRIVPAANAGFQPDHLSECHEQKVPLRSGTGHSPYDFPQVGTIALVQIGDGTLATIPGEVTTTTGTRIRRSITANHPGSLAIAGLTNQYFQYFATHEEYAFQFYEGASTLYGPHSEQFLVRHFTCLAAQLAGRPNECGGAYPLNQPSPFESSPAPRAERWPEDESAPSLNLDPLEVCEKQREGAPGWEMEIDALPLTFTSDRSDFSVAVLFGDTGNVELDDDRGASIEVREAGDDKWRIRWIPDLTDKDARCGQRFRLAVRGQVSVTSRPFVLDCSPAPEQCAP